MSDSTVTIAGSLGQPPELRFTAGGRALCSFSVAVSRRWQSNNEWQEATSWFDVTAWGQLAENCAASLIKGTRVVVTGRLETQEWEDRNGGGKRSKVVIVADDIGASLKWATATVERLERETGNYAKRNATSTPANYTDEEEPF